MFPNRNYCYQMGKNLKEKYCSVSESNLKKQKLHDAKKKHAESEKWRRWRINGHMKTLGELLRPNMTSKKVKASILTETVRQVKALRKRAAEAGLLQDIDGWFHGSVATSPQWTFPGECDEVKISSLMGNSVKATICCEDRQGLTRTLTDTIRNSGAKAVRVDISTIGARAVYEVVVRWPEGGGREEEVGSLRRGLKSLVDNHDLSYNELGHLLGLEKPNNYRVVTGRPVNTNWELENLLFY